MKSFLLFIILISCAVNLQAQFNIKLQNHQKMKIAVWDTYVTKKNGQVMHFDIMAPAEIKDPEVIYKYGREYLKTKGQEGQPLSAKQCRFCHYEAIKPSWEKDIQTKGYFIYEMENCE
jgi:Domain of unknown function (DUF2024)